MTRTRVLNGAPQAHPGGSRARTSTPLPPTWTGGMGVDVLQSHVTGDPFSPEECVVSEESEAPTVPYKGYEIRATVVSEESEAPTVPYKGYEIRATPLQLPESGEWTLDIEIVRRPQRSKHRRKTGDAVKLRPFRARNTFPTQEEATADFIPDFARSSFGTLRPRTDHRRRRCGFPRGSAQAPAAH